MTLGGRGVACHLTVGELGPVGSVVRRSHRTRDRWSLARPGVGPGGNRPSPPRCYVVSAWSLAGSAATPASARSCCHRSAGRDIAGWARSDAVGTNRMAVVAGLVESDLVLLGTVDVVREIRLRSRPWRTRPVAVLAMAWAILVLVDHRVGRVTGYPVAIGRGIRAVIPLAILAARGIESVLRPPGGGRAGRGCDVSERLPGWSPTACWLEMFGRVTRRTAVAGGPACWSMAGRGRRRCECRWRCRRSECRAVSTAGIAGLPGCWCWLRR